MIEQSFWYLENIDLRQIFCPSKLEQNSSKSFSTFAANNYIYLPNEPAEYIYLIHEGRIKIGTYSDDGKEITKAVLGAGEVFGELAIMGLKHQRDFAFTMETTKVCAIQKKDMGQLLRERSELQLIFMKMIGQRTLRLEQRLESLVFKSSRKRILDFLVSLADTKGRIVGQEVEVRQMLTHKEIADLTATSRQTVNGIMNELRDLGLISFNRQRMLVRDMDQLRRLAKSN